MKYLGKFLPVCLFVAIAILNLSIAQPILAETITDTLSDRGWEKSTTDFLYPQQHPRLHLSVRDSQREVNNLEEIRNAMRYLRLTFDDPQQNIDIYPLPRDEVKRMALQKKLTDTLYRRISVRYADKMQSFINALTGLGIDI